MDEFPLLRAERSLFHKTCVYHFALPELQTAVSEKGTEKSQRILEDLIEGRRPSASS